MILHGTSGAAAYALLCLPLFSPLPTSPHTLFAHPLQDTPPPPSLFLVGPTRQTAHMVLCKSQDEGYNKSKLTFSAPNAQRYCISAGVVHSPNLPSLPTHPLPEARLPIWSLVQAMSNAMQQYTVVYCD